LNFESEGRRNKLFDAQQIQFGKSFLFIFQR